MSGVPDGFKRLRRKRDFERAYREGKRLVNPFFVAFALETTEGLVRAGVVASRKVGGAVVRNRAKRLLREVFRKERPRAGVSADLVLVARGALAEASYHEVEASYRRGVGRWLDKVAGSPR